MCFFFLFNSSHNDKKIHLAAASWSQIQSRYLSQFFIFFLWKILWIFFLPAAVLLPLILGAIILISKKAAFLSKLALFISGFFGVGGLAAGLGGLGAGFSGGGGFGHGGHPGFGGGHFGHNPLYEGGLGSYKVLENNTPRNQEDNDDRFYDYDKKHLLKDRASRLYERESDVGRHLVQDIMSKHKPSNQRTFVWATTKQN